MGNDEMNLVELFAMMGTDLSNFNIEFLSNSKFRMSLDDQETEGAYKITGNTIVFTNTDEDGDEQTLQGKIEGNKITLSGDASKGEPGADEFWMIFERK